MSIHIGLIFLLVAHLLEGPGHPHVLVKAEDRSAVLQKIAAFSWAKNSYSTLVREVEPYVTRHREDPQWILSRYQMNWEQGRHYTHFYAEGTRLRDRTGNAPVPTIRVSSAKRKPLDPDGYAYQLPQIEHLTPYDARDSMYLQSAGPSGRWDWVDPGALVGSINGAINELALKSAFVYWLTGKEAYGQFAEDILLQWARGARYNEPLEGSDVLGFLTFQTLNDASYRSLALVYDFIRDRLQNKASDTEALQIAFEKLARTQLERGYAGNNWYAAEMPTMLFAGLALKNEARRQRYIRYFLDEDYGTERIGQRSLRYTVEHWFTADGHWKEPPAYHNYPVVNIMLAAMAAEKNDVEVFRMYPALFRPAYAMTRFLYPNGKALGFGDNHHRVSQNAMLLELALAMAVKYHHPDRDRIAFELGKMIASGYDRSDSGLWGLLFYVDTVTAPAQPPNAYPVTNALEFAACYSQRLGEHPQNALMYAVQGATYNHNHANGIAMELYGKGYVLGADPGADVTYETDLHREYYSMYAAHNTVIAAGRSGPTRPGFTKHIGQIELKKIEPPVGKPGVSDRCAFSMVSYTEPSTGTAQERLLAIVKATPETGYYVDIFRSDNQIKNEYVYHNIGHKMLIRTAEGKSVLFRPTTQLHEDNGVLGPGYKHFLEKKESGIYEGNVLTTFILNEPDEMVWMNVHSLGNTEREYFSVMAPRTHTAPSPLNELPTPTLVIRQTGEAWNRPFVNVFEPSRDHGQNHNVQQIRKVDPYTGPEGLLALEVTSIINKKTYRQYIFKSDSNNVEMRAEGAQFQGMFGIVGVQEDDLQFIYMGHGTTIGTQSVHARFVSGNAGSFYLEPVKNGYVYSATEPVALTFSYHASDSAYLKTVEFHAPGKGPVKVYTSSTKTKDQKLLVQALLPAAQSQSLELGNY
jgi:hypothetical protein